MSETVSIPTNTPCVFHVETTWKRSFPHRFNVEYTWCVFQQLSKNMKNKRSSDISDDSILIM